MDSIRDVDAITVTALNIYPFKSCAGLSLKEASITPTGLEHDRTFMVVDDDDDFVSQRKVPELAVVVPRMGERSITLSAPGMRDARVPLEPEPDDEKLVVATVHNKPVVGQVVGEHLDRWFTDFLPRYKKNHGFRLLRVREDVVRPIADRYRRPEASDRVGFADGHPISLATEPSLARLNAELDEPVPMNRFRPNIVLDGDGLAPYDEDFWTRVQIGELPAFVVKACDRCVTTDVEQDTGVTGTAVRRALARTRKGVNVYDESNTGVFFMQNLNHVYTPGVKLRVGDTVEVLERSARPNVLVGRAGRGKGPARSSPAAARGAQLPASRRKDSQTPRSGD